MADPIIPDPNSQTPPPDSSASGAPPAGDSPPASPSPAPGSGAEPHWAEERLRVVAAQKHEEKTRREAAEAELARLRSGNTQIDPVDPEATRAEVNAQAAAMAANMRFNDECNKVAEKGRAAYGAEEFDGRIKDLMRLVTPGDDLSGQAYMTLISAAMRSGKPEEVIHQLGGDLKTAQRIMSLDPMGMAAEVTKLATGAVNTDITRAPKPITPVTTKTSSLTDIDPSDPARADNLSSAEWFKRRNAQIKDQAPRGARFR